MTEEMRIIERVIEGDVESFRLLVQRYQGPVLRMIRNIVHDEHASEDIGQDVFLTAFRKLTSFDPARSQFSTWIFTIARNRSLNALKRNSATIAGQMPDVTDPRRPGDELDRKEFFVVLDKGLRALPPHQKIAFVLAEIEELSYEDIAQIEGVRMGTIKSRINRAKQKLRSALADMAKDDT